MFPSFRTFSHILHTHVASPPCGHWCDCAKPSCWGNFSHTPHSGTVSLWCGFWCELISSSSAWIVSHRSHKSKVSHLCGLAHVVLSNRWFWIFFHTFYKQTDSLQCELVCEPSVWLYTQTFSHSGNTAEVSDLILCRSDSLRRVRCLLHCWFFWAGSGLARIHFGLVSR